MKNRSAIAEIETPQEETPETIIAARMAANTKAKRIPNAAVYDRRLGYADEYLDNPPSGRRIQDGKLWLYPVIRHWNKNDSGKWIDTIEAVPDPDDMDVPPQSLFRVLKWEPLIKGAFADLSDIWQKLKVGFLVALVAIGIFALYLFTQS
ncbi:hypothetical protein DA01_08745 [Dehalococcoides mccartyi]|uniref:Uncharacterized protein n=1 Tax=Dehalococcoides mccartyi TaxID=61435 RepID=A0A0V8LXC3_9CHLR|nr:hypothetical protein [Dehalococcoides mccartyi]KSV16168.1 hypothetical protein DA01_08745 [Dehalococcoides mccartyi]